MGEINLFNGVSGIMFKYENAGDVIDFIMERTDNPMKVMQYNPKYNVYLFGKSRTIILDGMYIVYIRKTDSFLLTKSDRWIKDYNY